MNKQVVLAALVASLAASAQQATNPSVAPFPLQVIRPANLSEKQLEELQATFKVLLRRYGAAVPDSAKLMTALKDLRRADCDRDNACLAQLAKLSGSLYGVFASLDTTADGDVVAWGRIVRDDGKAISEVGKQGRVKVPKGAAAFTASAETALMSLIAQLGVKDLPATRPVEPVAVTPAPIEVVPYPPPPPPEVVQETPRQRTLGMAAAGVGAAGVVVGLILVGAGAGVGGGSLEPTTGYVYPNRVNDYRTANALQMAGAAAAGVGVGLAVLGGLLALTAKSDTQVSIAPISGGAVVGIGGVLP